MRTHPVQVGHLVAGLLFLGIAGLWALNAAGVVDPDGLRWLLPLTLVAAGATGLVAATLKAARGRRTPTDDDLDL